MTVALACPNCNDEVPSENINDNQQVAVCPVCDTIFPFEHTSTGVQPISALEANEKPKRKRQITEAGKPLNIRPSRQVRLFDDTETGGIEIHYRPGGSGQMGFVLFFTILWNGFMIVWYVASISMGAWDMAAFGSLHGLVGLALAYWTGTHYLNKTRVIVTDDKVRVLTTPIFVHPPREFGTEHIVQLSVKHTSWSSNGKHHYLVYVDILGEGEQKMAGAFADYNDAAFVEQQVERFLGIEDESVPGEISAHTGYY